MGCLKWIRSPRSPRHSVIRKVSRSSTPALCRPRLLNYALGGKGGCLVPPAAPLPAGPEGPAGCGGAGLPKFPLPRPQSRRNPAAQERRPRRPGPGGGREGSPPPPPTAGRPNGRVPSAAPRPRPGSPPPPAAVSPRAPRRRAGPVGGRCRAGPPSRRPLEAPSPLTSDEDSLGEGHCAAGGGARARPRPLPRGPAHPGPARLRWKPGRRPPTAPRVGALPPLAALSGRRASASPGHERASRPLLLPTVTAPPRRHCRLCRQVASLLLPHFSYL